MPNPKITETAKNRFQDVNKESDTFKLFIQEAEKSPLLVEAFNQYGQGGDKNIITVKPGLVISSGSNGIRLPEEIYMASNSDPMWRERLILGSAHELGHRNNVRGHGNQSIAATPEQAKNILLENEGVAITQEYLVANELREYKKQQGIINPTVTTWTPTIMAPYDQLAAQHAIGTKEFEEQAIKLGGSITASLNPSGLPNLTYAETAEFQWIFSRIPTANQIPPNDSNIKLDQITTSQFNIRPTHPSDFSYQVNAQGETVFAATLPINYNTATQSFTEKHQFVGKTDALGKVVDIQNLPYNPQRSPEQAINDYQNQSLGTINIAPPTNSYASSQHSPEIQALHDKIGGFLYPTLEKSNVSQNHADSMVATAVQQAVNKNISADEVMHAGVDKTKNLIGVFTKEVYKVAAFDAVEASKNDPEKTLAAAQQQLEQQPMQEQQRQQQMEQQTKERSAPSMGM